MIVIAWCIYITSPVLVAPACLGHLPSFLPLQVHDLKPVGNIRHGAWQIRCEGLMIVVSEQSREI